MPVCSGLSGFLFIFRQLKVVGYMVDFRDNRLFPPDKNEIIKSQLVKFNLPDSVFPIIENLIEGKISEDMLICCNGGCEICQITVKECYLETKDLLIEPV